MRSPTRRVAALVLVLAGVIALAGCGGDDGGDDDAADRSTTTTADESGPTEPDPDAEAEDEDEGSTTSAPDETTAPVDTTGPEGSSTPTGPGSSGGSQEGAGAPDEEATDVDWGLTATSYRGRDGERIAFLCPPDGDLGVEAVWGTETYRDDSSVCIAAVHAGLINPIEGGRVVIEVAPGAASYEGSAANGLTTAGAGAGDGSFTFPVG